MVKGASDWEEVARKTRVVTLSPLVAILIPSLAPAALGRSTRGLSYPPGAQGVLLGSAVLVAGALVASLLGALLGGAALVLILWLFGSAGVAMLVSSVKPIAFVKPICTRCRLRSVIVEHEAIHLAGEGREDTVWASMRRRHTPESLKLAGDPAICPFCPIPKRLAEQ